MAQDHELYVDFSGCCVKPVHLQCTSLVNAEYSTADTQHSAAPAASQHRNRRVRKDGQSQELSRLQVRCYRLYKFHAQTLHTFWISDSIACAAAVAVAEVDEHGRKKTSFSTVADVIQGRYSPGWVSAKVAMSQDL